MAQTNEKIESAEKDEIVDPFNCQNSHQLMLDRGNSGVFKLIKNATHDINQEIIEETLKLCEISTI